MGRHAISNRIVSLVGGVFGLQWVLATIVGWVMGWLMGVTVVENLSRVMHRILWYEEQLVFTVILGGVIGILQWLVLRKRVRQMGWWVLACAVGMAASPVVSETVELTMQGLGILQGYVSMVAEGVLWGAVIGTAQWFVLRRGVNRAGWWLLASIIGVALGWPVLLEARYAIVVRLGMMGFVSGAITGWVLIELLRNRVLGASDSDGAPHNQSLEPTH